jgi:hypothetical protein
VGGATHPAERQERESRTQPSKSLSPRSCAWWTRPSAATLSAMLFVDAEPVIEERRGDLRVLDGRRGFGQLVREFATDLALDGAATRSRRAIRSR